MNRIRISIMALFFSAISSVGYAYEYDSEGYEKVIDFLLKVPRPEQWGRINIEHSKIKTVKELREFYKDRSKSKEEYFHTAYNSILNNIRDEHMVFFAISILNNNRINYAYEIDLLEYALDRNISYNREMDGDGWRYSGKPGDTIGGFIRSLAMRYNWSKEYNKSIDLIESFLKLRENDVNHAILEFIALEHAGALKEVGRLDEAIIIVGDAIKKYDGPRESWLMSRLENYTKEKLCLEKANKSLKGDAACNAL